MPKINTETIVYVGIAIASGIACWFIRGPEVALGAITGAATLLLQITPLLVAALLVGGYFKSMIPHERIATLLGDNSGWKGLAIATLGGALTPGGPFASFPLAVALIELGADAGTAVAYLTAWSVLGINRIIIWDVPLLGMELSFVRVASSLILPFAAGLLARLIVKRWPIVLTPDEEA